MNQSIEFWNFVRNSIEKSGKVAFLKVVASKGSSPGRQGFMLAVNDSVEIRGTVGGGVMEFNAVENALKKLRSDDTTNSIQVLLHKKNVPNGSGLICSGSQTIADFILTEKDISTISKMITALELRLDGLFQMSPDGLTFDETKNNPEQYFVNYISDYNWLYQENYGQPETIYIFGGGHVGLAISKIFSVLDFYTIVFDNRPEAPTVVSNTFADQIIIGPFNETGQYVQEGMKSYAIIVSSQGLTDIESLAQVIQKKMKYIGLMGSETKKHFIFKTLIDRGISRELFNQVIAPVGIEISSNTPEEIAISVAAEIIKIKNSQSS